MDMCSNGLLEQDRHFATKAIHVGQEPEQWNSRAVTAPISLSTTFKQEAPAEFKQFEYSRSGNPTRQSLEACLAALEQGKYGFAFSSGLSATTTICHLLQAGDHMIAMDDLYGGTYRYFTRILSTLNVEITLVDARDPNKVKEALKPNTKLLWIETPTNPTMKLVDIQKVSDVCHAHSKDMIVATDNTFMSAYFQKPLLLGSDLVIHSLTKYMNGHSDVVMGAIVTSREDIADRIKFLQNSLGTIPSPFDSYLVLRSLKTLHLRMKEHMRNGIAVATFLETHPGVQSVIFPGLKSHPQHELAVKQCQGFSGMVTFYIKGGLNESREFLKNLKVFTLAESLGGYESLAELPAVMTHASVSPEHRAVLGVTDSLIRLSVGLEDTEDLLEDLDQALKKAVK